MARSPDIVAAHRLRLQRTVPVLERVMAWMIPLNLALVVLLVARSFVLGAMSWNIIGVTPILVIYGVLFLRKRMRPNTRLIVYCSCIVLIGLNGMAHWGLFSQGFVALMLGLILASLGGVRHWLGFLLVSSIGMSLIAVGFVADWLAVVSDFRANNHSPVSWVVAFLTLSVGALAALLWDQIVKEQVRSNRAMERVLEATSDVTGERFFERLTSSLAEVIEADLVALFRCEPESGETHLIGSAGYLAAEASALLGGQTGHRICRSRRPCYGRQ